MTPCFIIIEPKRNHDRFCAAVSCIFVDISLDFSFNVSFNFIKSISLQFLRSPTQFSPSLQVFFFSKQITRISLKINLNKILVIRFVQDCIDFDSFFFSFLILAFSSYTKLVLNHFLLKNTFFLLSLLMTVVKTDTNEVSLFRLQYQKTG